MIRKLSNAGKGRLYMVAAALLWGLAGVCVKSIPWHPMSIMASRCFFATIILALNKKSIKISKPTKHTILGAVFQSLTGIFYIMSVKLTTAATAIVLQYVAPILVFLFSVFVQKIKPKKIEAVLVFVVFAGCFLSFADRLDPTRLLGNILGLASGFTFAAQIIACNDSRANPSDAMFICNIASFFVGLPFMFFDKEMSFTPSVVFWVVILGVFQYGLANAFYARGCQKVNKVEGSLLLTIEPIFNPIPTWIVTGETMSPLALVGFFIVIGGVSTYGALPLIENLSRKGRKVDFLKRIQ